MRTLKDEDKSNNKLEGWHNAFNKLVSASTDINWFLHRLITHHHDNMRRLDNNYGGEQVTKTREDHRAQRDAIKKAVEHYANQKTLKNVTAFLEKVARQIRIQVSEEPEIKKEAD